MHWLLNLNKEKLNEQSVAVLTRWFISLLYNKEIHIRVDAPLNTFNTKLFL